ncbi:hypothetical protein R3P38DRAFT_3097313 [Favolaschia claudopus]|uniref:Uncharacterized protein n=1 Tax=Favolaschia claudopus TaxID=2862362 RepID=A0AAV9ZPS8_9AGAR
MGGSGGGRIARKDVPGVPRGPWSSGALRWSRPGDIGIGWDRRLVDGVRVMVSTTAANRVSRRRYFSIHSQVVSKGENNGGHPGRLQACRMRTGGLGGRLVVLVFDGGTRRISFSLDAQFLEDAVVVARMDLRQRFGLRRAELVGNSIFAGSGCFGIWSSAACFLPPCSPERAALQHPQFGLTSQQDLFYELGHGGWSTTRIHREE